MSLLAPLNETPLGKFIEMLSERDSRKYYLVSEAASMVGRSADTLTRWRKAKLHKAPSMECPWAGYTIHLYTEEDIEELRGHLAKDA